MRVVIDTNTAVSGLLWSGSPRQVLDAARSGIITVITSPLLLAEFEDVIRRPKFSARMQAIGVSPDSLIADFALLVHQVTASALSPVIAADPDDDEVLACAVAARATLIVSGDGHLLDLARFRGIEIVTARQLVTRLSAV